MDPNAFKTNINFTDNDINSFLNSKQRKKATNLDIKDRYWVYLFQNLKLAVDEIYKTCETDESISECEKAISILQKFINEFRILHQKLQLMKVLEIPNDIKPMSLKWENSETSYSKRKDSQVSEINEIYLQTINLHRQIGKVDQILAMTNPYYNLNEININEECHTSVPSSNAPSPDYYNRLSDVSSVLSTTDNNLYENLDSFKKSPIFQDNDKTRDWYQELNNSRSTDNYKIDNSDNDHEDENSEYTEYKDYYGLMNSLDSSQLRTSNPTPSSSTKQNDLYCNDDDTIDEVMLKVYEHEEDLARALEKEQDEELRSVIEQEVKLTKQLSVEQLKHFGKENYEKNSEKHKNINILSKDYYTGYVSKLNHQFHNTENELENDIGYVRAPSRAIQIHERIMQTSRKTSPSEHRRRHEEKQARAQEKRERFYEVRAQKLRELTAKINEVRKIKLELLRAKKLTMKAKLKRAEEKRLYLLQMKAKKAADEEQKAHEILFINNLKEQNRRQDILERYEKRNELRRQNLEEERIRKQEEQKTKEQAAEVRRKELESQRIAKLKEIQEKRLIKQSQIEKSLLQKEKERLEIAKAKEKTREQRLEALKAQFKAKKEEEKKRILQKQEEWSKRHESNLEEIRKKAFEMSVHHGQNDDQNIETVSNLSFEKEKWCKLCDMVLNTEIQLQTHFRCLKHQQMLIEANQGKHLTKTETDEFNLKCIIDFSEENQIKQKYFQNEKKQTVKKKLKKLKSKIISKGNEYESTFIKYSKSLSGYENNGKMSKLIKDLSRILEIVENGGGSYEISGLDRICREIIRIIEKNICFQNLFFDSCGLTISSNLLNLLVKTEDVIKVSTKSVCLILELIYVASKENVEICINILLSNKIFLIIDVLCHYLNRFISDNFIERNNKMLNDSCVPNLIQVLSSILLCLTENEISSTKEYNKIKYDIYTRFSDIIGLLIGIGVFQKLSIYLSSIRKLNEDNSTVSTIVNCLNILKCITKYVCYKKPNCFDEQKNEDINQLANAFKLTGFVGIISMMYGLLHNDSIPYCKNEVVIDQLPNSVLEILTLSFMMLNQTAVLDINMFQSHLGEENLSLQLRHITSFLLWYCTHTNNNDLLNEIILFIGYYTVLSTDNQIKIELGTPPTVLQLLCTLPFNYFSDPKLSNVLFPTLICCCYKNEKNRSVLSNEVSTSLLANYVEENINSSTTREKVDSRFEFGQRFPEKLWIHSLNYLSE